MDFHADPHSFELVIALLFGGPLLVFYGLSRLDEKRLIQNTPRSKVRSAAMGMVELRGTAAAPAPQQSPISGLPCAWWHCKVQELVSSGKSSHWQTIKELGPLDPFYLVDDTGKVPVNPWRAELRVASQTTPIDSSTRTALSPVLRSWGVYSDLSFFSMSRSMRVIEQFIAEGAPIFVYGELISLAESPASRAARRRAYIEAAKADPKRMNAADTNHDGQIDGEEWDRARTELETEFDRNESLKSPLIAAQQAVMVHAPAAGNFIISSESEEEFMHSLTWQAPLAMVSGIAASGLGVWVAIMLNWSPGSIIGVVGAAFVVKLIFKKGAIQWS